MGVGVGGLTYRYSELFLKDASELVDLNQQGFYAPFLWSRAVCPDEHPAFFSSVVRTSCGNQTSPTPTLFFKVRPPPTSVRG